MNVTVIGTGYVGLVSGAGFADFGNRVTCVDIDQGRIDALLRGEIPFYEPGLGDLVARNRQAGRLAFSTSVASAVAQAQVVILAVGTPPLADGNADLNALMAAARNVGQALTAYTVVVTKSTVPVGTGERIAETIAGATQQPFAVASNPEFLKEGDAVNDFLRPARVVIGVNDERARNVMTQLYEGLMRTGNRVQFMDLRSAELTKHAANAMLATRISFMNELALLADQVGANVEQIRVALGSDPRIGPKVLFPGIGFGGSCFPKDLRALAHTGRAHQVTLGIVEAAIAANQRQGQVFAERIIDALRHVNAPTVALWGLSFKPETDDIRESPALQLAQRLSAAGIAVTGYDPIAMPNVEKDHPGLLRLAANAYQATEGADALVLVTEWHELRKPDYARLQGLMRGRRLFDGRNVWNPEEAATHGFEYRGVGYPGRPARG